MATGMFSRERDMRPAVDRWVRSFDFHTVFETSIFHLVDIMGVRFAERTGRQVPPLSRLIAVELKLHDVAGVLYQCKNNAYAVNQSWAAMPTDVIRRMRPATIQQFSDKGTGLLAVDTDVSIVIPAVERELNLKGRYETMRRRFWRYLKADLAC